MAASRIKGITIEIGGDTTKLQTALKGIYTEIKSTQSQLKDVKKLENDTSYKGLWTLSFTLKEF
jgi:phage-related minor tail protein